MDAGALGQPITFNVTVFANAIPYGAVNLFDGGKQFQTLTVGFTYTASSDPRFAWASKASYTISGPMEVQMFGMGRHTIRAVFPRIMTSIFTTTFARSTTVATFRVKPPALVTQPSGVGIATVDAGSGPALQPGQTATVRYNAYIAASYRLFYSTESQTPDTTSFVVDANPEQVIPGLDAGVVGMQAGETRAIYVPYKLAHGPGANAPPRANRVYLVTLVSIG